MKKLMLLSVGVLSFTLFSFKPFAPQGVELLSDGNYIVEGGVLSQEDVSQLTDITFEAAGAIALGKTLVKHKTNETVIFHDRVFRHIAGPDLPQQEAQIRDIMNRYM